MAYSSEDDDGKSRLLIELRVRKNGEACLGGAIKVKKIGVSDVKTFIAFRD